MTTEATTPPVALRGRRRRLGDLGLRLLTGAAVVVLATGLVLLVWEVFHHALPAIQEFGLSFLTGTEWNAVTDVYGARYLIWGTLVTSLIALLIAVPMSIAIGLFLSELAPRRFRLPMTMLVELLAAIPSVVLGLWGILVMGPFLAAHVEPFLSEHFGWIPGFNGYPSNQGLLPACLVLTIMVVPIVASISRELFTNVPSDLKQGSMALGATRWEMVRSVVIPQVSGGLVAAVMLGFGRAVGEAIAVTQVIGGANAKPTSFFGPADTMASRIAAQYSGAATTLQRSSLYYLAVILLVMSLATNLTAQLISGRLQRRTRGEL